MLAFRPMKAFESVDRHEIKKGLVDYAGRPSEKSPKLSESTDNPIHAEELKNLSLILAKGPLTPLQRFMRPLRLPDRHAQKVEREESACNVALEMF